MLALGSAPLHQNELSVVLEAIEDPAIVISHDHEILNVNRRYLEAYGGPEGVEGRRCYEILHRYTQPCEEMGERCPLRECCHGEPSRAVHVHHTPSGARHEEITAYPVTGADGKVISFLEVIRPFRFNAA